jgi:hypothetical protein
MSIKDIAVGRGTKTRCMDDALHIAAGLLLRVVYAGLVKNFFEPELKKRVEAPLLRHCVRAGVKA